MSTVENFLAETTGLTFGLEQAENVVNANCMMRSELR